MKFHRDNVGVFSYLLPVMLQLYYGNVKEFLYLSKLFDSPDPTVDEEESIKKKDHQAYITFPVINENIHMKKVRFVGDNCSQIKYDDNYKKNEIIFNTSGMTESYNLESGIPNKSIKPILYCSNSNNNFYYKLPDFVDQDLGGLNINEYLAQLLTSGKISDKNTTIKNESSINLMPFNKFKRDSKLLPGYDYLPIKCKCGVLLENITSTNNKSHHIYHMMYGCNGKKERENYHHISSLSKNYTKNNGKYLLEYILSPYLETVGFSKIQNLPYSISVNYYQYLENEERDISWLIFPPHENITMQDLKIEAAPSTKQNYNTSGAINKVLKGPYINSKVMSNNFQSEFNADMGYLLSLKNGYNDLNYNSFYKYIKNNGKVTYKSLPFRLLNKTELESVFSDFIDKMETINDLLRDKDTKDVKKPCYKYKIDDTVEAMDDKLLNYIFLKIFAMNNYKLYKYPIKAVPTTKVTKVNREPFGTPTDSDRTFTLADFKLGEKDKYFDHYDRNKVENFSDLYDSYSNDSKISASTDLGDSIKTDNSFWKTIPDNLSDATGIPDEYKLLENEPLVIKIINIARKKSFRTPIIYIYFRIIIHIIYIIAESNKNFEMKGFVGDSILNETYIAEYFSLGGSEIKLPSAMMSSKMLFLPNEETYLKGIKKKGSIIVESSPKWSDIDFDKYAEKGNKVSEFKYPFVKNKLLSIFGCILSIRYVRFICQQGEEIVTSLEHLKYVFLKRSSGQKTLISYNKRKKCDDPNNNGSFKILENETFEEKTFTLNSKKIPQLQELVKLKHLKNMSNVLNEQDISTKYLLLIAMIRKSEKGKQLARCQGAFEALEFGTDVSSIDDSEVSCPSSATGGYLKKTKKNIKRNKNKSKRRSKFYK